MKAPAHVPSRVAAFGTNNRSVRNPPTAIHTFKISHRIWRWVATDSFRAAAAAIVLLWAPAAQAAGAVTDCTEASLRSAMASGGTVTFACDGTITLTETITNWTDTILDGRGHQVTISGGNAVGLFYVGANSALTILHLTLADGWGQQGGAVFNDSGIVNLQDVLLWTNVCTRWSGGAIYNLSGTLSATNQTVGSGTVLFHDAGSGNPRFYRVMLP